MLKQNSAAGSSDSEVAGEECASSDDSRLDLCWLWMRYLPSFPSSITSEIAVDDQDACYVICQDCLRYLRAQYPLDSLESDPHSQVQHVRKQELARPYISLGAMVNTLADRYAWSLECGNHLPEGLELGLDPRSARDRILYGVLATAASNDSAVCQLQRHTLTLSTPLDLYEALFLDCLLHLWKMECMMRSDHSVWSPMPWSRESREDIPALRPIPGQSCTCSDIYCNSCACNRSNTARALYGLRGRLCLRGRCQVNTRRWGDGAPLDVPWHNGPHDGYPFCPTLPAYVRIRRTETAPSFVDDAALWVGAMSFGLLEAVTRTRISQNLLLAQEGQEPKMKYGVISGDRVHRLVGNWSASGRMRRSHTDENSHTEHGNSAASLLERAYLALHEESRRYPSLLRRAGYEDTEVADMVCALHFLVVTLEVAVRKIWGPLPALTRALDNVRDIRTEYSQTVLSSCRDRMLAKGWCPHAIHPRFMSALNTSFRTLSNALRLPPPVRRTPREHDGCTADVCVFYTVVDTDVYTQRHVNPSCCCDYTKPPLEDVERHLIGDRIPVLSYNGRNLEVHPAEPNGYIAISHVWADGMGSTTQVGLPTCQMQRIAALAEKVLPGSRSMFWMDSLCIPGKRAAAPEPNDLRRRAILLMAKTYEDAAKVLVLDEFIRTQCSVSQPWEENLFRMATSGWVRRVWTLQEGILARELYFEFAEGPVDIADSIGYHQALEALDPSSDEYLRKKNAQQFCQTLVPILHHRRSTARTAASPTFTLDELAELLLLRSTKNAEDELIASSRLLPGTVQIAALLAISGPDAAQRRMRAFFRQLPDVPVVFPLLPGRKLTVPGYTWAPHTLTRTIDRLDNSYGTGRCTEDGLHAAYHVAPFDKPIAVPRQDGAATESEDAEDVWYEVFYRAPRERYRRYRLIVEYSDGNTRCDTIDALLFAFEVSTINRTRCFAVHASDAPPSEGSALPRHHFRYVAPAFLFPVSSEDFAERLLAHTHESATFLKELEKLEVLLM